MPIFSRASEPVHSEGARPAVSCRQSRPQTIGGREGQMKAIFWTVSLIAGALLGLGDVMHYLAATVF